MTESQTGPSVKDGNREPPEVVLPAIKDFEVIRRIGKGGFGSVYLVHDVTGNPFALKVVRRVEGGDNGLYEREYNSLCSYRPLSGKHPSLLTILHIGTDEGGDFYYYYTMPLADDLTGSAYDPATYKPKTLKDVIPGPGKAMPVRDAITAVLPVLDALDFLHKAGLLHRDVKPANILIIEGKPVLGDIGLIAAPRLEMTRYSSGGYSPPGCVTDKAGDLYSVGMVLYAAVGGDVDKYGAPVPTIQFEEPSDLFPALNIVIGKARKLKYKSAAAMIKDLEKILGKSAKRIPPRKAPIKTVPVPSENGDVQPVGGQYRSEETARGEPESRHAIQSPWISRKDAPALICMAIAFVCEAFKSSQWPNVYNNAVVDVLSTVKALCYVAFLVLVFLVARRKAFRTMTALILVWIATVYLNGKISMYYREQYSANRDRAEQAFQPQWEDRIFGGITIKCPRGSQIKYVDEKCYAVFNAMYPKMMVMIQSHVMTDTVSQTGSLERVSQWVTENIGASGFKPIGTGFKSIPYKIDDVLQTTWSRCDSVSSNGLLRSDIIVLVEDSIVLGTYESDPSAPDRSQIMDEWVAATSAGLRSR